MSKDTFILDLETTGLISAYGRAQKPVGISEFALRSVSGKIVEGGYTDILGTALSTAKSSEDYFKKIQAGTPAWQPGITRPGDVLAGVHERHLSAVKSGAKLHSESAVLSAVGSKLADGHKMGGWNVEFDFNILASVATRQGNTKFLDVLHKAKNAGQIEEMSDPARKYLFGLAKQGKISLGNIAPKAVMKATSGQIDEVRKMTMKELWEPHEGFKALFSTQPAIDYTDYKKEVDSTARAIFGMQEFSKGMKRPEFRYTKGWRQQLLAEAISPGFLDKPTSTLLGQEMAKRVAQKTVTAHEAKHDVVLTGILQEVFGSSDPAAAMQNYGVRSEGQFITQYKSALERDVRDMLETYQNTDAVHAYDRAYMRKVYSGAQELADGSRSAADAVATTGHRIPKVRNLLKGTVKEVKDAARKHPKTATAVGVIGSLLLADAFIPEDNRLEGRRKANSKYSTIDGIAFGAINTTAAHQLTDFGTGRDETNASSLLAAWRTTRAYKDPEQGKYSAGDVQKAQRAWGSAISQQRLSQLSIKDMDLRKFSADGAIPGLRPDVFMGVVDLKDYKTKVDDADTITLARKGLWHLFDDPIQVRLSGIDAPETHPSWPFGIQPAGHGGTKYLQEIINTQQNMTLLLDPFRNTYGRHTGVISGDVHPNINLKLVTSGAASSLPSFGKGITDKRKFAAAEARAANEGLGMWASKGWQAKRLLDLVGGERVTNTSLANMERLATRASLAETYGLVQGLDKSTSQAQWDEGELQALYKVMEVREKAGNWQENTYLKRYGWKRGINDGSSPWGVAGSGISPSRLPGANVSAFGSGWSVRRAEQVLRSADPLRRRFIRQAEPLMKPGKIKTALTTYARRTKDKLVLSARTMAKYIDTSIPKINVPYKTKRPPIIAPLRRAQKPGMQSALIESSARTAINVRGPALKQNQGKYLGALYAGQQAYGAPYRPLNEYKAVTGWGFPGSWQEGAWASFNSGAMENDAKAGYKELYQLLRKGMGLDKEETANVLHSSGIHKKFRSNITKARGIQEATGMKDKAAKLGTAIWRGHIDGWWDDAKASLFQTKPGTTNALAKKFGAWGGIKKHLSAQLNIRKHLWHSKMAGKAHVLSKVGGFLEFMAYAGKPLEAYTPTAWKNVPHPDPGTGMSAYFRKAKNYIFSKKAPSKEVEGLKTAARGMVAKASGSLSKETNALLRGAKTFGKRATGKFGIAFDLLFAASRAGEYRNSVAGFGIEFAAASAEMAVMHTIGWAGVTTGASIGAMAGIGIGGAIGAVFGGVGAPAGALIGKYAGMVIGGLVGGVATLAATILAGEAVRMGGRQFFSPVNTSPHMPSHYDRNKHGIPGTNNTGGMDTYLTAGHGIQNSEFTGFGGGLKPLKEATKLGNVLGKACGKIVGAIPEETQLTLARPRSKLKPTAGLTTKVLWKNRKRIARPGNRWPVQWDTPRKPRLHHNRSRLIRAT